MSLGASSTGEEADKGRPDHVFGLVGPTGTNLDVVERMIRESLSSVGYSTEVIRLSAELELIPGLAEVFSAGDTEQRLTNLMTAGTKLCEVTKKGDAVVALALGRMQSLRRQTPSALGDPDKLEPPQSESKVYLLRGLKRPEEVETLRGIYGPWFVLFGASTPQAARIEDLAAQIRVRSPLDERAKRVNRAYELIETDRNEVAKNQWGQNVGETFPLADVFLDASSTDQLNDSVCRFIELLFGNRFHTPSRHEQAMCHAQVAAYRSASLSRQVGAAITSPNGSLVATGMNEVPRSGGGPYWEGDPTSDKRDHALPEGMDPSVSYRDEILTDLLSRLNNEYLTDEMKSAFATDPVATVRRLWDSTLSHARLRDITEFQRAVHAEMMALATGGLSDKTKGSYLYCTTFPCHVCARMIVASGVDRVYYIDPYPKSLVRDMYSDSISLDDSEDLDHTSDESRVRFLPFSGIAPRRYFDVFSLSPGERRSSDGSVVDWQRGKRTSRFGVGSPRLFDPPTAQIALNERDFLDQLDPLIRAHFPPTHNYKEAT